MAANQEDLILDSHFNKDLVGIDWDAAVKAGADMSQAELSRAAEEAAKRAVLDKRVSITNADLGAAIAERKAPTKQK